jgi:hypothetical protein
MTTPHQPDVPPPAPEKKAYAAPHLVEYGNIANLTGGSKGSFSDGKRRRKGGKGKGKD